MRIFKMLLLFSVIMVCSLCPLLPNQTAQDPDPPHS
jgi:hypothetical protein